MQEGGSDNTLLTSLSRNKSVSFISVGQENEEILNLPSTETLPVVGTSYLQISKYKAMDQSFVIPIFLYRGRFEKETRFQSHSRSHNQKQHYKSETAVSARHQRLSKRLKTSYIPRRSLQFSGTSNRLEMFHLSLFCVSIPQCISWYNTHRYYSKLNLAKLSKSESH